MHYLYNSKYDIAVGRFKTNYHGLCRTDCGSCFFKPIFKFLLSSLRTSFLTFPPCLRVSVVFFFLGKSLLAQSIFIQTFTTQDSILIRWVPANVETWKLGNKNGYIIERFLQSDFPGGNITQLSPLPMWPLSK